VTVVIAVMARYPYAGEVKTRLAPRLDGAERATVYRALLADKLRQLDGVSRCARAIAFTPAAHEPWFRALVGPGYTLIAQPEGPLGARVVAVFDALLAQASGAILCDSDTPDLPPDHLAEAARALEDGADLVLGPAADGGYYLVGLRRPTPALFEHIEWSSPRTRAQTLAAAARLGLRVALLPEWYDVDEPDDLTRLERALEADAGAAAPHTWAALAALRVARSDAGRTPER
jgi:uncharacterized protein